MHSTGFVSQLDAMAKSKWQAASNATKHSLDLTYTHNATFANAFVMASYHYTLTGKYYKYSAETVGCQKHASNKQLPLQVNL